jgi:hypothetical protein
MMIEVRNCSACGRGHKTTQTVEEVDPAEKPGKKKKPKHFFYCPVKGEQIFLKELPADGIVDLKEAADAA